MQPSNTELWNAAESINYIYFSHKTAGIRIESCQGALALLYFIFLTLRHKSPSFSINLRIHHEIILALYVILLIWVSAVEAYKPEYFAMCVVFYARNRLVGTPYMLAMPRAKKVSTMRQYTK